MANNQATDSDNGISEEALRLIDRLYSLQRMSMAEEKDAKERGEFSMEHAQMLFIVLAHKWQCSREEAVSKAWDLWRASRTLPDGRDVVTTIPYNEYLKTEHWQGVRQYALLRADHRCQLCNSTDRIEVHHRTYERKGIEDYRDVIALCHKCHAKFHNKENGRP